MKKEKHRNTEELIKYLESIVEEVIKNNEEYSQQVEEVFVTMIKIILMKKMAQTKLMK